MVGNAHLYSYNADFFGILVPFISYVMAIIGYLTSLATYRYAKTISTVVAKSVHIDVSVSYSGKEIEVFYLLRKGRLLEYWYKYYNLLIFYLTCCKQLSSIHFFGFQVAMVVWGKELHVHTYVAEFILSTHL